MFKVLVIALATAEGHHVEPDVSCGTTCDLRNLVTNVKLACNVAEYEKNRPCCR